MGPVQERSQQGMGSNSTASAGAGTTSGKGREEKGREGLGVHEPSFSLEVVFDLQPSSILWHA